MLTKNSTDVYSGFTFINTIKDFESKLITVQKERGQRLGTVEVPHVYRPKQIVTILEWNLHELNFMTDLINSVRAAKNKEAVTLLDVRKVEVNAMGHSDYTHKFALYCAELALDL